MTKYDTETRFRRFFKPGLPDECWLWTGYLNRNGYGFFWDGEIKSSCHRYAYRLAYGPVPPELDVHHKCEVRCCVNPAHLDLITRAENLALRARSGEAKAQPRPAMREHDVMVRFFAFVDKRGDGCWVWTGTKRANYGRFGLGGRSVTAHRFSYEQANGPIPAGLQIDHLCKNTLCVNPEHLEAVTQYENNMRSTSPAALHAKKTHCPKGHAFAEWGFFNGRGSRECRACIRVSARLRARARRNTPPERQRRTRITHDNP